MHAETKPSVCGKRAGGTEKLKDTSEELGVTSSTVRKWKVNNKWEESSLIQDYTVK
ncbi:phage terminase small subunit-related protein [Bacillus inaquosorum]|uniref:Phage terminase small subunit-related protein n=1 Tax=Bacillus inaquosorum TaxID=483913 RepID=A0A9Q4HSS7_9BACI|nr:phage terminase small subunit-related protein [Bacillus inaquosorum]MCY7759045.1 phage terminase small subunit-related protein [Bacillus inaquosorum]MCY7765873.1 phage terminase small subunit-related protein [Bacillus inaquosorum]MCY7911319.1 phage terminase small subunit-related protein [Bacillus inaquosorum]MCY7943397.1 phage terminase small subunit-related protein [Bacillus inaquosorum]MCY7963767.1 phage terminase small subunit-related protein [Bacillus inaquosorum]